MLSCDRGVLFFELSRERASHSTFALMAAVCGVV